MDKITSRVPASCSAGMQSSAFMEGPEKSVGKRMRSNMPHSDNILPLEMYKRHRLMGEGGEWRSATRGISLSRFGRLGMPYPASFPESELSTGEASVEDQ